MGSNWTGAIVYMASRKRHDRNGNPIQYIKAYQVMTDGTCEPIILRLSVGYEGQLGVIGAELQRLGLTDQVTTIQELVVPRG